MAVRRRGERPFARTLRKQVADVQVGEDSAWREMPFSDAVLIDPPVTLRKGEQYSFVEMKDLVPNDRYVRPSRERELTGGSRFYTRDTLFARITPCLENGKIAQVIGLEGGAGFGSTEFIVMRGKLGVTDIDFVHYLSISEPVRRHAEMSMSGTSGRQRADVSAFDKLIISLPPLPIQQRIAEILGALDDKIECNRRINVTLENMAMALYKHWFVDFGPFRDGKFVDSEVGRIPEGWENAKLKNVCEVNKLTLNPKNAPEFINYIDISSVSRGSVNGVQKMIFKDAPSRARRVVNFGDIVWSMVRPERKSYFLVLNPEENMIVSTGFAVITPRTVPFSWVYLTLTTDDFVSFLASRATGAAYPAVTDGVFKEAEIILPRADVLQQFHQEVEPWFYQIAANEQENKTLARTRDYLLPKLLSGEVRAHVSHGIMGNSV